MAITENYIVIPETSLLRDVCKSYEPTGGPYPGYKDYMLYDKNAKGRFLLVPKEKNAEVRQIEADDHFFVTHLFNAFEDGDKIHVDVLKYDSNAYESLYVKDNLFASSNDDVTNQIARYSIDLKTNTTEMKVLHQQEEATYVEFSNINPMFYGKTYR